MATGPVTEQLQKNSGTQVLEWDDAVKTVESADTPFLVLVDEGKKPAQMESNWLAEKLEIGGVDDVPDGQDVSDADYRNNMPVPMKGVAQEVRDAWKVTEQAEVTETHGTKDQVADQKAKSLIRLRLKLEQIFLSTQELARQGVDKAKANKMRGAARWLSSAATDFNVQYPIAPDFRILPACEYKGALSAFDDATFEAMLLAASIQRKARLDLDLQAGPKLQSKMADWTQHDSHVTTTNGAIRSVSIAAEKMTYLKKVEFFTFEAGTVRTHTNFNLFHDLATGLPSTQSPLGGLALDMNNGWEIRFVKKINHKNLPDLGGGPRGLWNVIVILVCKMPAGQLKIYPSGA